MTAGSIAVPTIIPLRAPVIGKAKNLIDTNTRIEIKSDTPGVEIYYTINGARPEPFQALGSSDKSTFRYKEPFTLPEGKITLKALATSRDGVRESFVNTKSFEVEYIKLDVMLAPPDDDDMSFQEDLIRDKQQKSSASHANGGATVAAKVAWHERDAKVLETEEIMADMKITTGGSRTPPTTSRFTADRASGHRKTAPTGSILRNAASGLSHGSAPGDTRLHESGDAHLSMSLVKRLPVDDYKQTMRLQKETDYLRCIYCYAARPSDPYARFCGECGNPVPPLPYTRLAPPEPGQMGMCIYCKSMVPLNTPNCIICEAPLAGQNEPQAMLRTAQTRVCYFCGTGNPPHLNTCVVCEARLPEHAKPIFSGDLAPPKPRQDGQLRQCSKCGRVNNSDARFCDWCGAKPTPQGLPLICSKCGASNSPYSRHCATCGVGISAPPRADERNGLLASQVAALASSGSTLWQTVPLPATPKAPTPLLPPTPVAPLTPKVAATRNEATQTVGLYYPSVRELEKKKEEEEDKMALEKWMRDRKPLLTAVSPGRGYWRKQVEHICMHLKAEAANNPEFRSMIGEQRMGKLLSAAVQEDGYEFTLTVNFALRGVRDTYVGPPLSGSRVLSDLTDRHPTRYDDEEASEDDDDDDGEYSDQGSVAATDPAPGTPKAAKKPKPKKKKVSRIDKLSLQDRKLLKELSKEGEGRPSECQALLDEGGNATCANKDNTPLVILAAQNKHADCIPVLVQAGADVNAKDRNGSTALHAAVGLGFAGREVLETLLGTGANTKVTNKKGETPYELAVSINNDMAMKMLVSNAGQSKLDKMVKPKSQPTKMSLF